MTRVASDRNIGGSGRREPRTSSRPYGNDDDSLLIEGEESAASQTATDKPLTKDFYRKVQKPHYQRQQIHSKPRHNPRTHTQNFLTKAYFGRKDPQEDHLQGGHNNEEPPEFDIQSNISGLTRESDFPMYDDEGNEFVKDKENRRDRRRSKSRGHRSRKDQSKTSFLAPTIRMLTRQGRSKQRPDTKSKNHRRSQCRGRARSYSPDRSRAASELSDVNNRAMHRRAKHDADYDESFVQYLRKRSKSADVRSRRLSRGASPRDPPRSSPKTMDPLDQYSLEGRLPGRLVSPEPAGTKLEDFAFRTPGNLVPAARASPEAVEPLGSRLGFKNCFSTSNGYSHDHRHLYE